MGHRSKECPSKQSKKEESSKPETEAASKKRPSAGLIPDMIGDTKATEASELFRAWGKVRDQTALMFFDSGARANFITPDLASKLGIRTEEMGSTHEAAMVAPGLSMPVTPIIGKLRIHIQDYVDSEEFYIMPLEGCDVILGMPWFHRVRAKADFFDRKITFSFRGRSIVRDVKLKGDSVPVVSTAAISKVIKNHLSAYLVFAKEKQEVEESNLNILDQGRL